MNQSDQDRLLKELLAGEASPGFRQASLECALASMRRRRMLQRIASVGAVAAVMGIALWQTTSARRTVSSGTQMASNATAVIVQQPARAKFQTISDDELLALFPDRPVALIGEPGRQRLVFLDEQIHPSEADGR